MIEAEKLTKVYGRRTVVRGVTFHVGSGEIVGLLGPNGAGKTTTMRMLTGYLPANGGKAIVAGYDVAENPMEVRKRLGYLPETVPLYTDMTVKAYLDFIAKIRGVAGNERRQRLDQVLEMCRISEVSGKVIGKLSRGYKQRVGLAQAIIHNPQVIILDEPTVGLDPRQIIEIRQVIRDLAGEHSMILSTHILSEVSTLCDRVIIINQGRVLVDDTLANLERQGAESERLKLEVRGPLQDVTDLLSGQPGVVSVTPLDEDEAISGLNSGNLPKTSLTGSYKFVVEGEPGSDHREKLAALITGQGYGLLELKTATPTLEEIFVRVISNDAPISEIDENSDDNLGDDSDNDLDESNDPDYASPAKSEVSKSKKAPAFLAAEDDGEVDEASIIKS